MAVGRGNRVLSVVIPAYNEERRLGVSLPELLAFLEASGWRYEVIVADDGSSDRTGEIVREAAAGHCCVRLLELAHRGKGHAVRCGMLSAGGDLVLFTDADLSTPPAEVCRLLAAIDDGADIAIGSRALEDSQILLHQPWWRRAMGRAFNLMVRVGAVSGIKDTQCGFKLFTRRAVSILLPRCRVDGFGFDVEVLYLARLAGLRIAEVPVRWVNSPESKVRVLVDPLQMAADVMWMRWMHRGERRQLVAACQAERVRGTEGDGQ
jgi:dolichyl-phosphate beta-glucosyltransferase